MKKTKRLVMASLFCALCCVGTMIHIPAGPTLGYVHLGDALVLLSGVILGPLTGGIAAGIGSTLADLINGYAIWAPGTFLIKALCAAICGLMFQSYRKNATGEKSKKLYFTLLFGGLLAELVMIVGYFFYEILITMLGAGSNASFVAAASGAAVGIPFNIVQALVALVLTVVLIPILLKIDDMREIILG